MHKIYASLKGINFSSFVSHSTTDNQSLDCEKCLSIPHEHTLEVNSVGWIRGDGRQQDSYYLTGYGESGRETGDGIFLFLRYFLIW